MCFHLPDYSYYLDIQVESYEEHCLRISMVDFGVCLVHVFENRFMFSKTRKTGRTYLFYSFIFYFKKHREHKKTLNLKKKNNF